MNTKCANVLLARAGTVTFFRFSFFFSCSFRNGSGKQCGEAKFMPFDENDMKANGIDEKNFQLSIHLSGGIFRSE